MRVISEKPPIGIFGEHLDHLLYANIAGIAVGPGRIAIRGEVAGRYPEIADMPRKEQLCTVLAGLGMNGPGMEEALKLGKDYSKRLMHNSITAMELPKRTAILRRFLDIGLYEVVKKGHELGLSEHETTIIEGLSLGKTYQAIATELDTTRRTISTDLARVGTRTGWQGAQQLILATTVSGEIGDYAPAVPHVDAQLFEVPPEFGPDWS